MRRRVLRCLGVTALVVAAVAVPARAGSFVADTIVASTTGPFTGGGGATTSDFLLAAGNRPMFRNSDPDASSRHNVVALEEGPDGAPLFQAPLVVPGGEEYTVEGAQYLTAGTYPFQCTIHQFAGMTGTLVVSGDGAVARPEVALAIKAAKLRNLKRGKLFVAVTPVTRSDDVEISGRVGGKSAGATTVDLAAGENRLITLSLGRQAKRVVEKGLKRDRKVEIRVSSTVPFGAPDTVTKKLK